ncbi:hypothetical protein MAFF211520_03260 [Ralstonia pseudosolanacearum]|nr:hypothetical protein MAFF211520_03260 [Ralstonia pseudosolanacearum]BEU55271.1 hypothetical protein MAFF211521_03240 [Ralstonia pseudosolanacearum]
MRYRPTHLPAYAIFVFSMALLVIVGAIYLDADGESFPAANLHLTQAE